MDTDQQPDAPTDGDGAPGDAETSSPVSVREERHESPAWLHGLFAAVSLYFFLSSIKIMGGGLKMLAKDEATFERIKTFFAWADNPVAAFFASVMVTALVQSSSFTTAMIVVLAADGIIDLETAVYAVMGANIGTSVTNIIVSMGNVRIRRQFRKAFTAALVHDVFNWLTVLVLFPIEWIGSTLRSDGLGPLAAFAQWMSGTLGLEKSERATNPISVITSPVKDGLKHLISMFTENTNVIGSIMAIAGLVLLFAALIFLVLNLKGALLRHIETWFRKVFFRNDLMAYIIGAATTVLVQSSSVTTSLIIPLAGAGAVKIKRVFPYTLGANLGTTITGVIAATAKIGTVGGPVAISVAIAHVTFNLIGTAIWYPLRGVPIRIAGWYAGIAARSRRYAFLLLFGMFFVLPVVGVVLSKLLSALFTTP